MQKWHGAAELSQRVKELILESKRNRKPAFRIPIPGHPSFNISNMMFPMIICLITLCTLTCAAASLDDFKEISNRVSTVTFQHQKYDNIYLTHIDMAEANEECARQCLLIPYSCQSFALIKWTPHFICRTFATSEANWISNPSDSKIEVQLYVTRKPVQVQDIAARFSHNDYTNENDWAIEIQTRYGLFKAPPDIKLLHQDVLRVCNIAIHGDRPMSVNIRRQLMDLPLNSWAQHSTRYSVTLPEGYDTIVLIFLEIFSKSADKDVITIYDPTEKMLFIQSKDLYLLIVSIGPGHYEVLRHSKSLNNLIQTTIVAGNAEIDYEQNNYAFELFKKIVTHVDQHATIPDALNRDTVRSNNKDEQSIAATALGTVAQAIFQPQSRPRGGRWWGTWNNETIFYRDIVTAVLSSLREKIEAGPFRKNLFQKAKTGAFKDTSIIITYQK